MMGFGGVRPEIDAFDAALQLIFVAHVAQEVAQRPVRLLREALIHFVLLQLVSAQHDQALNLWRLFQYGLYECLPERSCAAGDEQALSVEEGTGTLIGVHCGRHLPRVKTRFRLTG